MWKFKEDKADNLIKIKVILWYNKFKEKKPIKANTKKLKKIKNKKFLDFNAYIIY